MMTFASAVKLKSVRYIAEEKRMLYFFCASCGSIKKRADFKMIRPFLRLWLPEALFCKNPDQQEPAVADGDDGRPPRENFVADAVLIFAGNLGVIQGIFGILNRNALRAAGDVQKGKVCVPIADGDG